MKVTTKSVSITATAAGASANVLYTAPPNYIGEVTFMHFNNSGASTQTISVQRYNADLAAYEYIIRSRNITTKAGFNLVASSRLYLKPGDKIVVFKNGGTLDGTISVLEHYQLQ